MSFPLFIYRSIRDLIESVGKKMSASNKIFLKKYLNGSGYFKRIMRKKMKTYLTLIIDGYFPSPGCKCQKRGLEGEITTVL